MPIFPTSTKQKPTPIRITRFRGLNVAEDPTQLANNESPDLLNVLLDSEGAPDKRTGYTEMIESLGEGLVLGIFHFEDTILVAHDTDLYEYADDFSGVGTSLSSSMSGNRVKFFTMDGICYIQDGTNYLQWNGTTLQNVDPYIPTIVISSPPAGGGTAFEQFNLIGAGFKQSFNGDNTAKDFQLTLKGLDATAIVASLDGGATFDKVEITHFTVNRTTGLLTWITAPALGTNNVVIRAFKTVNGKADLVRKCVGFAIYGGTNDTRIFKWQGNTLYRSDVYRPNYWPENTNQKVGSDDEDIMGMTVQYDTAVIEKARSKWGITYYDDGTKITFPARPINSTIGCLAPESVQIIENNPVTLTRQGVHMLSGGTVRDERNVSRLSLRVDRLLLAEDDLQDAVSIDFDKKYYLALNGRVYIWDYLQPTTDAVGEWYLWDSLPISCFMEMDGYLYFGTTAGAVMRFNKRTDENAFSDNGEAIEAYYMTKQYDFSIFERLKSVPKVFTTFKSDVNTSVQIYTLDGNGGSTLQGETSFSLFSYASFDYSYFTYLVTSFPRVLRSKVKLKKIPYLQLKYVNDKLNQSLKILGTAIEYDYGNYVK